MESNRPGSQESKIEFTEKQHKLAADLGSIRKLVEQNHEQRSEDVNIKIDGLLADIDQAIYDVENGMESLPPGLTVAELRARALNLVGFVE